MTRGMGEHEVIQELIPEWMAIVVALLTQLGDIWFLTLVLAALFWYEVSSREDIATIAGVWLAGTGLYMGLKAIFGFARPDAPLLETEFVPELLQPLYEVTAFATGYGFPSGHAVGTTIVYFGLAFVLTVSTRRQRFATAALLVAVVCLSRVILGVHYLVDIIAGVGVGALLLAGAYALIRWSRRDPPTITFGLAIVFGAFFFFVASAVDSDAVILLVVSVAAFAGRQFALSRGR